MFLYIRMGLYLLFGTLAGTGLGFDFDSGTGMVSFHVDALANILVGLIAFAGTFWTGRIAKRNGGET